MSGPQAHGSCLVIKNGALHLAEHNVAMKAMISWTYFFGIVTLNVYFMSCVFHFFEQKWQGEKSFWRMNTPGDENNQSWSQFYANEP